MRRTVVILLAAGLTLAGCSTEEPGSNPPSASAAPTHVATGKAACRKAIKAQYVPGTAKLKGEPGKPKECAGLSSDEVSEIALQVIEENTR
jgi:hypothetical protein